MAMFDANEIAGDLRRAAIYWDKCNLAHRARVLRRWADELDPPAIKCTASCCGNDALFRLESRLELPEHDDEPRMISFRCGDHVATWMMANGPFGSIKADLL